MLNISVCDDDLKMLDKIEELVNEFCMESNIKARISRYTSGEAFLDHPNMDQIDILFLDIRMNGISGLDVAGELRKVNDYAELIFITSYDEYMRYLFAYGVSGYLSKPIDETEFRKILERVSKKIFKRGEKFYFKVEQQEKNVVKREILFIEIQDHDLRIKLENDRDEKYIGSLKEAKEQLPETDFVQLNRSYIANMNQFKMIGPCEVVMMDDTIITISRTYKKQAMAIYLNFRNRKSR